MKFAVLALSVAVAFLAGAMLAISRTETIPAPYGYIQHDRWTGETTACSIAEPRRWADDLKTQLAGAGFSNEEISKFLKAPQEAASRLEVCASTSGQ